MMKMKKWVSLLLIALILLAAAPVAMADPEITEDSIITIVNCKNYANVHELADKGSKVLGWAPRGNIYKLLAAEGNYYKIQYKKETVGYVHKSLAKVGKKTDPPTGKIATVTNAPDGVNIRAKASSKSKILGVAYNGETFQVKGTSGKWTKVAYDGGVAFIFSSYLTISGGTPNPPVMPGEKGYICAKNYVTVRAKASSKGKKLGTLKRGAEVSVTAITGSWSQIAYKGDVAYVLSKYISATKPDDDIIGKTATIVNCKVCVNVRAKASSSSKKLGTADLGTTWTVLGQSGNWIKVDFNGEPGFIYKKYTAIG